MRPIDVCGLLLLCSTWGLNFVVLKYVVTAMAVPPLFFSGVRFLLLFVCLLPWLAVPRDRIAPLATVGILTGGAHFGLLSLGLLSATSASAAVMTLLGVPMMALLSVVLLKETLTGRRAAAIGAVLAGAAIVMVDPTTVAPSYGLLTIACGIMGSAVGVAIMKRMSGTHALQVQAWVGAVSGVPLLILSLIVEGARLDLQILLSPLFWLAQAFSVACVSVLGHTIHYSLVKRYDLAVVAALTLLTPVFGVAFSVVFGGERLPATLIGGSLIVFAGSAALVLEKRHASA